MSSPETGAMGTIKQLEHNLEQVKDERDSLRRQVQKLQLEADALRILTRRCQDFLVSIISGSVVLEERIKAIEATMKEKGL